MSQNGKNVKFEESHMRADCMREQDIGQFIFNEIKNTFLWTDFVLRVIEPFERLVVTQFTCYAYIFLPITIKLYYK